MGHDFSVYDLSLSLFRSEKFDSVRSPSVQYANMHKYSGVCNFNKIVRKIIIEDLR